MGHSRGRCTAIVKAALDPHLKYLVTWVSTAALGRYSDEVLRATVTVTEAFHLALREKGMRAAMWRCPSPWLSPSRRRILKRHGRPD
jgi:hypothetical protein